MRKLLLLPVLLVAAGCADYDSSNYNNDSVDPDISEYTSLQSAWDEEDIDTQVNVCLAIEDDPSIARSTAVENNVDPDIAEAFFDEVCP